MLEGSAAKVMYVVLGLLCPTMVSNILRCRIQFCRWIAKPYRLYV